MTKKIVKRTDTNNETLYFYTHSDAVDVGEGSNTKSLTEVLDDTLHKSAQTLTNAEKTQALTNLGLNGVDDVPTENSNNVVRSGGVKAAIDDVIDDFTNRGFMYKGIAPVSAPLGEDKTFYIAKSGEYSAYTGIGNDGSFSLNGIAVLTYATATTSGAWTKNDIVLFDEEPTVGSDNLVKSGGVADITDTILFEPFLKNSYINAVKTIIENSDWYIGKLIPFELGDVIKYNTPDDITHSSSQKAGYFNDNYELVDINSISNNRTVTIRQSAIDKGLKYIAISTRISDAEKFMISVNGKIKYKGIPDAKNSIPLLRKDVQQIEQQIEQQNEQNQRIFNNKFIGDGNNYVKSIINGIIVGHTYRIYLKNTIWDTTGVVPAATYLFVISSKLKDDSFHYYYGVYTNSTTPISDYYDITVVDNTDNIIIGGRAAEGEYVEYSIIDLTPTIENDSYLVDAASKYNAYINKNTAYTEDADWYVSKLFSATKGDTIIINTPTDVGTSSPQKLGYYDADKNLINFSSITNNRNLVVQGDNVAFVALSVRNIDAHEFRIKINNLEVYKGTTLAKDNVHILSEKINNVESKTDIYSKNIDKLPILRAASKKKRFLQIIIATDVHGDWKAFQNVVDFSNKCDSIDAVIALGDYPPAHIGGDDFQQFKDIALTSIKPILSIAGNHDVGYDSRLIYHTSNDVINNYIIEPTLPFLTDGEHTDGLNYYYHDFVSKKIRIICLFEFDEEISIIENENWEVVTYDPSANNYAYNTEYAVGDIVNFGLYTESSFRCKKAHTSSNTNDIRTRAFHGYRFIGETQANWLVNTLASTPSDYGIVICTHIPSYLRYDEYCRDYKFCEKYRVDKAYYNYHHNDFFGTICDAFNKGISSSMLVQATGALSYMNTNERDGVMYAYELTYDFTNKNSGARFLCFLAGHTHTDFIMRNSFGQYSIITRYTDATTRPYDSDDVATTSNDDDIARDAVTVVAFNTDHNNATLTRIGTTATSDGYLRDVEAIELLDLTINN